MLRQKKAENVASVAKLLSGVLRQQENWMEKRANSVFRLKSG